MCTCTYNPCHTLRKAITNIAKSNTLALKNARNKFAHRMLMCTRFPMGFINIHRYENDTNAWMLFAYTRWVIFILGALIQCLVFFFLVNGVCSYVLVSKRSLNAHFERKLFLFFQGFSLESRNPNFELFSVSIRQV